MKNYQIENVGCSEITGKGKLVSVEVLSIDEAKNKRYLKKQDAIDMHTWHKGVVNHVDDVHLVYANNVVENQYPLDFILIKHFSSKPTKENVIDCVLKFINE